MPLTNLSTPLSRGQLPRTSETSRLMSPRDPSSLSHQWRKLGKGNGQSQATTNQNGAIIAQINRLGGFNPIQSSGAHPFQIYQLPSQFRSNRQPNDYLKVRCRQGCIAMKPRTVPSGAVGTAIPAGLPANNNGTAAWVPILNGSGVTQNMAIIQWANPLDGSGSGVPIIGNNWAPFNGPPFRNEDEIYLANGGDPEYLMPAGGTGWFWLQLDDNGQWADMGESALVPTIHFGGITNVDGADVTFGDAPPWIMLEGGGVGIFNLPQIPNIQGQYFIIGEISTFQGQMWINQFVNWHFNELNNNFLNWAGTYSENFIYWTGDVVFGVDGVQPRFFMQMLGYNGVGDDGFDPGLMPATQMPFGVSGWSPDDDAISGAVWVPLGFGYTYP